MNGLSTPPVIWAQAAGSGANTLESLALRRWCSGLTLSSPGLEPSLSGLWAGLAGLAGLLFLTLIMQGPAHALRQVFDLPSHVRLVAQAMARLRHSGRVVAVTIGLTLVSWTVGQIRTFQHEQGKVDLLLLTKSRSLGELGFEQGVMAALTPLRDVLGLGDNLPLMLVATILLFRDAAEGWGGPGSPERRPPVRPSAWRNAAWVGTAAYFLYRLVLLGSDSGELPVGGCLTLEVVGIPLIMVLADGIVLAWILAELRNAGVGETGNDIFNTDQAVGLMPGAALTCLAGLPARYLATFGLLGSLYLPSKAGPTLLVRLLHWQLSWGLVDLQGASLPLLGLAGAVAWSRGTLAGTVRGFGRLLSAEGGHLLVAVLAAGLAAGSLSAVAYVLLLAMPPQTWVLSAADGYAHYATLPIGLLALAALVELGERSLPTATLIGKADAGEATPTPATA
ncbi:MAG: hypothetical protein JOZ63_02400 [Planctomycetaceae bacterium]|nr:hypothetical protein [Planctomycetaceae bacterium]